MRPQPPKVGPQWLKPGERKVELLLCSDITYWVSHWDPQSRRSVRCGASACYFCQQGAQKIVRGVVLGVDNQGRERFFEVRQRHEDVFESYSTTVGLRISIIKTGRAVNSPVNVKVLREEMAYARDITRLVECLGSPAVLLGEMEVTYPARRIDEERLDDESGYERSKPRVWDND